MSRNIVSGRRVAGGLAALLLSVGLAACTTVEGGGQAGSGVPPRAQDTAPPPRADKANDLAGAPGEETDARRRAKIRLELAAGFYQQGNHGQALEELRRALAADGSFAQAYGMLGLVYMSLNELPRADESFQRALKLTPNDPEVLNNYGWFLCQSGRPRESLARFEAAARDPLYVTPARSLHNAGICALRAGDEAGAEQFFLRSFQLDPRNPVAMYQLGELYLKRGDLERARFHAQRLLSAHPPSAETVWLALRVERQSGNTQAVSALAGQLRRDFPQSPEVGLLQRGEGRE